MPVFPFLLNIEPEVLVSAKGQEKEKVYNSEEKSKTIIICKKYDFEPGKYKRIYRQTINMNKWI